MEFASLTLTVVLALIVGFAIQRGNTCAVAAAHQLVLKRRAQRTKAFMLAACWSAIVVVPLSWLFPAQVMLSAGYPVSITVMVAAATYGVGAYVNGACAFGTLSGLTRGTLDYLGTIVGFLFGAVVAVRLETMLFAAVELSESPVAKPSATGVIAVAIAFVFVARATFRHYKVSRKWRSPWRELVNARRWRPAISMAVLGVSSGLLYATAGDWTYMAVLSERAAELVASTASDNKLKLFVAAAALVAGGVLAAYLSDRFVCQILNWRALPRKFLGGVLMSAAAALLPGGNDELLLYGLPSLVSYAIVAHIFMLLSLYVLIYANRTVKTRR